MRLLFSKAKLQLKFIFVSILTLVLLNCKSHRGDILVNRNETELPLKVIFLRKHIDSTKLMVLIPQEFEVVNKLGYTVALTSLKTVLDLRPEERYLRTGGVHFLRTKNGAILGRYGSKWINPKFSNRDLEKFRVYAEFEILMSNLECEKIINEAVCFYDNFNNRKSFNINTDAKSYHLLTKKIIDMSKSYISINFYNKRTKMRFSKYIRL